MPIERDFILKGLLQHNFLPFTRANREELPPIFSSESFTPQVANLLCELSVRREGYDQLDYKLSLFNGITRVLSIPHPLAYAKLCSLIYENWEHFEHICLNANSKIKPELYEDGRVFIMTGYDGPIEKAHSQLELSFGKRFKVCTDIANCFPSIYTHAVPWALVGLNSAKQNRQHTAWFNQIDKAIRDCKRGETQGIAIGPGTSNLITESILVKIDEVLRSEYDFIRFIDDYICYCETEEKALSFVRDLERELAKYKLVLNAKKTKISRLPEPTVEPWLIKLLERQPTEESYPSEVFRFFDFAVQLSEENPESSVLKYAVSLMDNSSQRIIELVNPTNYLLNIAFHRVEILPLLTKRLNQSFFKVGNSYVEVEGNGIDTKLRLILEENIKYNRSDGMAWVLFHLARFNIQLENNIVLKIISSADPIVLCTLYWGYAEYRPNIVAFCNSLNRDDAYELDKYWLLLYQVVYDGLIDNPYTDEVFEVLRQNRVSFLISKEQFVPQVKSEVDSLFE